MSRSSFVSRRARKGLVALALAALVAGASGAQATSIIEGDGLDISSDIDNPTPFELELGSNTVTANSGSQGTTGGATNGSDAEFLTVVVPDGLVLDALQVVSRSGVSLQSFIAWNVGESLSGLTSSDIFDGALFFAGIDLLAGPSASNVDQSLGVEELGPGSYAFWIQETAGEVDYTLDFVAVPEPGAALLVAGGLIGLAARGRRRS